MTASRLAPDRGLERDRHQGSAAGRVAAVVGLAYVAVLVYAWPLLNASYMGRKQHPDRTVWLTSHLERRIQFHPDLQAGPVAERFRGVAAALYAGRRAALPPGLFDPGLFPSGVIELAPPPAPPVCHAADLDRYRRQSVASLPYAPMALGPVRRLAASLSPDARAALYRERFAAEAAQGYPLTILFVPATGRSQDVRGVRCGDYLILGPTAPASPVGHP